MLRDCFLQAIERQAAAAVAEADSIVVVMDGQVGLTAADEEIVSWLRRAHPSKSLHLAINKCENPQKADIQVRQSLVDAPGCLGPQKTILHALHA